MTEDELKILAGKKCPYCGCGTLLVNGDHIYPHKKNESPRPKYLDKGFFVCEYNQDHYVGTYHDNKRSLGRLADKELRKWKSLGHQTFDPLWKEKLFFKTQKRKPIIGLLKK